MTQEKPLYLDPAQPVTHRVENLLGRMTLPEKVGQLMQLDGQKIFLDLVNNRHVGSLLHINGSDADAAIRASLKTRLGIPVLLADDGIHGHSFWAGATIFPTQLGPRPAARGGTRHRAGDARHRPQVDVQPRAVPGP